MSRSSAQLFSGAAWAAYELASFQLLVASAGEHVRLRFLAVAACMATTAGVLGALLGAFVLDRFALSYQALFGWNTLVRAVPLALFAGFAVTRLPAIKTLARGLVFRLETVRPAAGAAARVVFPPQGRPPAGSNDGAGGSAADPQNTQAAAPATGK